MPVRRRSKSKTAASKPVTDPLIRKILDRTASPAFKRYLQGLLVELCRIDTTPSPDVARMRQAEAACFSVLERELGQLSFAGKTERRPINPAIQTHPFFSLLHFTKTPSKPEGLSAEETYSGRSNLLYTIPGSNQKPGSAVALNAHLDVVAPYFPPSVKGATVHGRGACDDKGPALAIVGALKVLSEIMPQAGLKWNKSLLGMFVVEEETGGNGSLSLATDRRLKEMYDSVVVCECTGLNIYPANRGAVWYRAEITAPQGLSVLELAAFIVEAMEQEGAAIRAESRHPLFPQRPVQTCHGILGDFGEHPSRICGEVAFEIIVSGKPTKAVEALVRDCLDSGLAAYVGLYGDKTKVPDPATRKPMVSRHYDLRGLANGWRVDVHGATGHMGSIRERDGAITKMAHLVRSLSTSKARLESVAGGPVCIQLASRRHARQKPAPEIPSSANVLVLEGGQGFVPTHSIDEVMERLSRAARAGALACLDRLGHKAATADPVKVTFEKLHNVAFDGDPNSPAMRHAIEAAKQCGLWKDQPILGWTVSCDARLFASEYPGMPVLTFGPGQLSFAHSDYEQIDLKEISAAAGLLAIFLLKHTGTLA